MIYSEKFNSEHYYDPTAYEGIRAANDDTRDTMPAMAKRMYICSLYYANTASEIGVNTANAIRYCKAAVTHGILPIAPHIYLTRFLDDNSPAERDLGLSLGLDMLRDCSQLWVFGGNISAGMRGEIATARKLHIPIKFMEVQSE
ncbi:hypothetical protein FACS1894219_03070 [Clostridia bacterium]|nr:hypothetical protein FACS1894219_03070 [Clostridia bacterium]